MNRDPVQRNCSAELHQRPSSDVTHGADDALRPWRHLLVCEWRTSVWRRWHQSISHVFRHRLDVESHRHVVSTYGISMLLKTVVYKLRLRTSGTHYRMTFHFVTPVRCQPAVSNWKHTFYCWIHVMNISTSAPLYWSYSWHYRPSVPLSVYADNIHCVSENAPTLKRYSSKLKGSILMIFGWNI